MTQRSSRARPPLILTQGIQSPLAALINQLRPQPSRILLVFRNTSSTVPQTKRPEFMPYRPHRKVTFPSPRSSPMRCRRSAKPGFGRRCPHQWVQNQPSPGSTNQDPSLCKSFPMGAVFVPITPCACGLFGSCLVGLSPENHVVPWLQLKVKRPMGLCISASARLETKALG